MLPCICEGNWRHIIHESHCFFDRKYKDSHGVVWVFVGVIHASDDYYYVMWNEKYQTNYFSCVAHLDTYGFTLIE